MYNISVAYILIRVEKIDDKQVSYAYEYVHVYLSVQNDLSTYLWNQVLLSTVEGKDF